jgi:ABC-type multidrug transport system fused ATPase/permease subunit
VWSRDKSVLLTLVANRLIAVLAIILAFLLPSLIDRGFFTHRALISSRDVYWLMPIYYSFLAPAAVALFSLDRLLAEIRTEHVFTQKNVVFLRVITWCCFAAGIILLVSGTVSIVFYVLAILAAFFGLILRVVKNLFAAAVALQDESDLTI